MRCEALAESRVTVSAGRRFSACLPGAALFLPDFGLGWGRGLRGSWLHRLGFTNKAKVAMLASFGGFAVGTEPNLGPLICEQSSLSADTGLW